MREFTVSFDGATASSNSLICIGNAGGTGSAVQGVNLEFLRFWLGQSGSATSNQQVVRIQTQASSWPTVMSSAVVQKLKPADANASTVTGNSTPTAGSTATASQVNAASQVEGAGTKTVVWNDAFNVLNGWLHVPTPPETRVIPFGYAQSLAIFIPAPTNFQTAVAAGLVFREV